MGNCVGKNNMYHFNASMLHSPHRNAIIDTKKGKGHFSESYKYTQKKFESKKNINVIKVIRFQDRSQNIVKIYR